MFAAQHTTMNAYVGVGNDISLAVKSILKVKKAYRTQMKCFEVLTRKNKSLSDAICELEKKNKDLKSKLTNLETHNEKQEQIVADLMLGTTGVDVFSDVYDTGKNVGSVVTSASVNKHVSGMNGSSEHKRQPAVCPTSPTTSNNQGSKRKVTPKKKSLPRKSRRLSNR